jgi:hypothetical protein
MTERSQTTVLRSLLQTIFNHLQLKDHEINFYGLATTFEKCADICRQHAIQKKQIDTRYQIWQHEKRINQYESL